MNLGFDAISQFPISQVAADNQVTVAINGNNLTLSIGPVSVSADAVTELVDGNQLTLGIGTVTIVGTANLEAPKTPLVLGTGNVTVTADANVTASGNNLIIRSGSVYYCWKRNTRSTGYRYDFKNRRSRCYYVERNYTRSNNGLDTN
jgi:hypothetical protein